MKITLEQITNLNLNNEALLNWYKTNGSEDLLDTLLKLNKYADFDARWLFTRLMTHEQNVEIAIYCAEQVLCIFENQYPNNNRPRLAIEAAKSWLKDPSVENRIKCREAASNAIYAIYATYAAYAADAASRAASRAAYATYAADAASRAADAASNAAHAIYTAYPVNSLKQIQEKIIYKAVEILDRDNQDKNESKNIGFANKEVGLLKDFLVMLEKLKVPIKIYVIGKSIEDAFKKDGINGAIEHVKEELKKRDR